MLDMVNNSQAERMTEMHLVGIIGNNRQGSYNKKLLEFIKIHYQNEFTMDLLTGADLPIYNQDDELNAPQSVKDFKKPFAKADGVIIATPEHNHSITAVLKNALDWASRVNQVLYNKPVMVVGAALGPMGTLRAQNHLRQILDSPGVGAYVLPGNDFLLTNAEDKFNAQGTLTDADTLEMLSATLHNFENFIQYSNPKHYDFLKL